MYRNNNYGDRHNSYSNRGGGGRGVRRVRTFNPEMLVGKANPEKVEAYVPKWQFQDFPLENILATNIKAKGYVTPTEIQDRAIPVILEGRDVVGVANTGTGKTAAFLIPLINKVMKNLDERVLIITPTRELALQVEEELKSLTRGSQIRSVSCIGGASMGYQVRSLQGSPQFVVGTPGRLMDLEDRRCLNFHDFGNIILDEVDRMLDMGFVNAIRDIVGGLRQERQSLFFSATLPDKVRFIMNEFSKDPEVITVKSQPTASNVDQDVIKLEGRNKLDVLDSLLYKEEFSKVLVFGRTKAIVEKIARELDRRKVAVTTIHGNKSQNQRQRALAEFKMNRVQVMIATDVASRGLDIDDVTHVINYDLPETYEDYVHRIGRTGRANKKGCALTFID